MEPNTIRHPSITSQRSAAFVLIMSLVTCGLYLIYWYYEIYNDVLELGGATPTGNDYFLDLLLVVITCGLWGVYVDYAISDKLNAIQDKAGMPANDTTTLAIILDCLAFAVGLTNLITSMIHQDQINKVRDHLAKNHTQPKPADPDSHELSSFGSTPSSSYKEDFGPQNPPSNSDKPGGPNPYD